MSSRQQAPDPFRRSIEEWDGEYPESWIPQPGETLIGQLVRYERGTTTYGDCQIAVVLDEDTGEERSVWLLHEVLRREFLNQRPKRGERIGIKRLADARNAAGQPYQKWALRVDRQAPGVELEPAPEQPSPTPPLADSPGSLGPDLSAEDIKAPGDDDLPF